MAEPKSNWGAEVKRTVALLEQKFDSQTNKLKEVASDVKQLVTDNASSKTSIRLLLTIVGVLFVGSILAQLWAGKQTGDKLQALSGNSAKIDTLLSNSAKIDTLLSSDETHAAKFDQLTQINSKQDTNLARVDERLRNIHTDVSRLETVLQTATSNLKSATDSAKQAANEAQSAAQDTLAALDRSVAEAKLDVFSIRAELSHDTYSKAAEARGVDPTASYFTVDLGVSVLPKDVRRSVATLLTPQSVVEKAGMGMVALKCSVTEKGKAVIMAWSTSGRKVDGFLNEENKLDIELVITALVDNVSGDGKPE